MKLTYLLSKAYCERAFIERGEILDSSASVELPADALTSELRAHLVRVVGLRVPAEFALSTYSYNSGGAGSPWPGSRITLDAPASDADALRLFVEDAARWDATDQERAKRAAETAAEQTARKAADAVEAERRRVAALAEAAERVARDADREAWIAVHGSTFLRKACGAGYDCQRRYVTERAALERPGFVVDFDDKADWKSRACPSEAALDLALAVGGTVVWLVQPPTSASDDPYWEKCEAVVITDYLGSYGLIKAF